jgi:superfamily II DNA or RNA helicase
LPSVAEAEQWRSLVRPCSCRALVITPNLEIRNTVARSLDHSSPQSFYKKAEVLANGSGPVSAVLDAEANVFDADGADFVIANIQQLASGGAKWLERFPRDYFDMILVDEGHHNVAASWQNVFEQFPHAKVTSFTATPLRADGKTVEGHRIYHFPISAAIKEGYVRDLASRRLEPSEIYFEYRGSRHRHTLQEVLELREETWFSRGVALSRECNVNIVDASIQCMRELREQGNVKHQIVAAACSIDHAKDIRSLYSERGLEADVIHSNLPDLDIDRIRKTLASGQLDAIVQVQMLGEGADYPTLGVAALFRPYRHLVPYVQFIGRIMRVTRENSPGHPDNRGFVVSHIGLNVDRWWDDLKSLDKGDQLFFEQLMNSEREFQLPDTDGDDRSYRPPMEVLEEVIDSFVEVGFLTEIREALADDVIHALHMRGVELETLGIDRRHCSTSSDASPAPRRGTLFNIPVQPQRRRQGRDGA